MRPGTQGSSWRPGRRLILYFHIGRNKAGSKSLQNAWVGHADYLHAHGIHYALFGQPNPPGCAFPVFDDHIRLRDFVRDRPDEAVLVSHEGICCFVPEMARCLATDLADAGVRVLFYLRPYRDWIVSSYNFEIRLGWSKLDFDSYLERAWPTMSVWPVLAMWADAVGWENVRVRSLDPRDLAGGDLATDGFAAIGLDPPPSLLTTTGGSAHANASPSWMVAEMLRAVDADDATGRWSDTGLVVAELIHSYVDKAGDACGVPADGGTYLSRAQANRLAELYNRDIAALAAETGVDLQPDDLSGFVARSVMPSAETVPAAVRRLVRDYALSGAAASVPDLADFVDRPLFRA